MLGLLPIGIVTVGKITTNCKTTFSYLGRKEYLNKIVFLSPIHSLFSIRRWQVKLVYINHWTAVGDLFALLYVVTNLKFILHVDKGTIKNWYDILVLSSYILLVELGEHVICKRQDIYDKCGRPVISTDNANVNAEEEEKKFTEIRARCRHLRMCRPSQCTPSWPVEHHYRAMHWPGTGRELCSLPFTFTRPTEHTELSK